ncbi:hypothetical protein [Streptococcus pluranimalium]
MTGNDYRITIEEKPDGVMWKETDFHKQKYLEKRNPIFKRGGKK